MFNLNTRIPSVQGNQIIQPVPQTTGAQQQNIFIYGNRLSTMESTGLPILDPQVGYPMYEYYKTYQLPTQYVNDGLGMLGYFKNCGFSVGYGYSATISLLNASAVDILTLADDDQVIVYYLNSASLIAPLVGSTITGTFDDVTATVEGVFVSAEVGSFVYSATTYDSKVILQSSDFATVAAGNNINISFNDPILVPDPIQTEPFIMNLYQAVVASLIPLNVNSTVATPNVYFAFLPDSAHSGLFGPIASPETLTIPTAASGSTITFAIPSNNVDLIPLSELGATTITQATSLAVGTVASAVVNGGSLIVTLINITGTFNATNLCTLHLDPTQTIFSFQEKYFATQNISLRYLPLIYPVTQASDIDTLYAEIFTYVAELNLPQTSQDGQAICQVVLGNITIPMNLAATTLPTNVNNYLYAPVWYPYFPVIGELPLTVGQLTSAFCMVVGSNVSPNNPQGGVIINELPVPTDPNKWVSPQIGGIADQVMKLGWNVISVNTNLQAYIINPISGQTTLPGTPTPDTEFYPLYVWDTVNQLRLSVTAICQAIGLGQVRQTPKIISVLKSNIVSVMIDMQNEGQLKNVLQNQKYITIKQDPTNPLGIDIVIPCQIIPGLEQVYYTISIFSSTINLQTAA